MLLPPIDLSSDDVIHHAARAWDLDVTQAEYAPVGFGSHHWWLRGPEGQRWFATVDDLRMSGRSAASLRASLSAAAALHQDGLGFVVAPISRPDGEPTLVISPHYVLALYPHIEGRTSTYGPYESHQGRRDVIERLVVIHQAAGPARQIAPVDDLAIPKRSELDHLLATIDAAWHGGPFSAAAHQLLSTSAGPLRAALTSYDALAHKVQATQTHWVLTHGEPHRANTIMTEHGVHLIDWETARRAPRERDLWSLIDEDVRSRQDYATLSGSTLDDDALDLYRRWWSLCEVSLYAANLSAEHTETPETEIAWAGLREHVPRALHSDSR